MDDLDNKIKKVLKQNINLSQDYENIITNTLKNTTTKNTSFLDKISKIAAVITVLFVGAGVYAYYSSEITSKDKYKPEQTVSTSLPYLHEENNIEYIDQLDKYTNAVGYEIITTYEKYLEYINKYSNMLNMSKEDFEKSMILIILPTESSSISNVYADEKTMYIELQVLPDDLDISDRWIIAKVDKKLYRNNIIIKKEPKLEGFSGYTPIFKLPENYSKEDAINDGCIVTEQTPNTNSFKLISNNQFKLDEFINKSKNGEEGSIRIINYAENITYYIDIYYYDGIYNVCRYQNNLLDEHESRTEYYSANQIIIFNGENLTSSSYGNREYHLYDVKNGMNNWILELLSFKF